MSHAIVAVQTYVYIRTIYSTQPEARFRHLPKLWKRLYTSVDTIPPRSHTSANGSTWNRLRVHSSPYVDGKGGVSRAVRRRDKARRLVVQALQVLAVALQERNAAYGGKRDCIPA